MSTANRLGRGFYLTTSIFQAKNWANSVLGRRKAKQRDMAALLAFTLDLDDMAKLESIWFIRGDSDFYSFVSRCRSDDLWHRRSHSDGPFDMVSGPVTLFPQQMVIADADQVSFHNDEAASIFGAPTLLELGNGSEGRFVNSFVH